MKVKIIFVGKTFSKNVSEICDEYFAKIKQYFSLEIGVISALKNTKNLSINEQRKLEGKEILKAVYADDFLVLLDDKGKDFTSIEFAQWIEKQQFNIKTAVFVIGGAYGFSTEVYERKNFIISLSKMTFSHQIIRAIFAEQLYRAMTILKGEPYHHEESLFDLQNKPFNKKR
ncbi:MAG: 23S rRNA (pseudouridine(1915)-N(3))-methyltransferase RlmH [Prevotellaceae bacterium]|jgi:23S rRNA (pseudouridine1915-N3)-methyltransferase|nr:23S rRNA (pseudouridine(1915)-N(3))-methyltransferase RlmH [Prevotellaceae bacterium]